MPRGPSSSVTSAALRSALAAETPSPITYEGRTMPEEVLAQDRTVQALRIGIPEERIRVLPVAQIFRE